MATNLLTVYGRKGMTKPKMGHKTRIWTGDDGKQFSAAILGQQITVRDKKKLIGLFEVFPFAADRPGYSGDYATSGEYRREQVDGKNKLVLGSVKVGNMWYVTTRTGLFPDDHGSTTSDAHRLNGQGIQLVTHNSFALEGGTALGTAEGAEVDVETATRLKYTFKRSSIPVIGFAEFRHDLWEMPVGASIIMRDVDGTLTRLIAHQDHVQVEDLTGNAEYAQRYDDLDAKRAADAARKRAERRDAGAQKSA